MTTDNENAGRKKSKWRMSASSQDEKQQITDALESSKGTLAVGGIVLAIVVWIIVSSFF